MSSKVEKERVRASKQLLYEMGSLPLPPGGRAKPGAKGAQHVNAPNAASSPLDFESFYLSVCSDLQERGEVHSMSKLFSTLATDEERMQFVLERNFGGVAPTPPLTEPSLANANADGKPKTSEPIGSTLIWPDFNYEHKDRAESQRLRNLGNQVYQKNKLPEALEFYSQSICRAPHPPPPHSFLLQQYPGDPAHNPSDDSGAFTHEELALGFANRSAVLFQMKEYDLCIRDITRAFDNSYPNNLMYKLFERRARCLKALKDYPRAQESMKSAEMWMKYSTLSETKSSSFKKEISKQVEQLNEKVAQMSISEFSDSADLKKRQTAPLKSSAPPSLVCPVNGAAGDAADANAADQVNKEIHCVRKNVKMVYSEDKGRHLVATEDINPGDLLIVETPYSSILLPEYYTTHCQFCYHRVLASIPCWCCAKARFCSDECRNEAWERFHKVECQQLNLILNSGVGKNAMLAMRILTSSGKIYLEYVIQKLREEAQLRAKAAASAASASTQGDAAVERMVGFNEENVYDPADYRTVYTLVSNSKQRGVGDLFKRSLMALYLLKILELTPFFYNGGSDPRNVPMEDKVAMGAVILRHLQNLPCNAHELSELELVQPAAAAAAAAAASGSAVPARDSTVHEIGAGVFSVLSLLNHSCDPNVVRHYYSSVGVVRAIRTIRKGEELLDNYGYHYAVMAKEERQRKLHNQYYFHCACHACANSWPLYSALNQTPAPLASAASSASSQDGSLGRKAPLADFQRSSRQYKRAFESVLQGSYSESLPVLLEHLRFLDLNMARPLREYNDCQEAIKQCYSALGNCHKTKGSGKRESGGNQRAGDVIV